MWQSVREDKAWWWAVVGVLALGAYGFVATMQPDAHFSRILAAHGGVFVAGSRACGMVFDGFRPDRWDIAGSIVCLLGVAAWPGARARCGPQPPHPAVRRRERRPPIVTCGHLSFRRLSPPNYGWRPGS